MRASFSRERSRAGRLGVDAPGRFRIYRIVAPSDINAIADTEPLSFAMVENRDPPLGAADCGSVDPDEDVGPACGSGGRSPGIGSSANHHPAVLLIDRNFRDV